MSINPATIADILIALTAFGIICLGFAVLGLVAEGLARLWRR